MGFIIKTPVTAEQNQNFIDNQATNQKIDALKIDLDNAVNKFDSDVKELDSILTAEINFLERSIEDTDEDVDVLRNDIQNEIERRQYEDTQINNRITSEVAILNAADSTLKNELLLAVESEAVLRATEINDTRLAILGVISNNADLQDIQNEEFRRQMASDTANFNNTLSGLNTKIETEIANRTDNDAAINGNILSLSERLTDDINLAKQSFNSALSQSVQSLGGSINTVSSTLIANTANLQSQIDANKTAISNEVTNRQNAITGETSARQAAINTVNNKIDNAIAGVQSDISVAVNSLQDFTKTSSGLVPKPPSTNVEQVLTQNGWRDVTATSIYINSTPSQINIPTYDKNSHTAEWLNFDTDKLSISGETAGVDAKTYTAKFKPVGLYVWGSDNTQSEKQVTWKINVRTLPKPTLSKVEYDYDANTTYNVLTYANNYVQKYMTVSGNTAKAIGDYTVKFSLDSKTNTTWSDGSTGDVDISYKVVQRLLTYEQSTGFTTLSTPTFDGSTTFKLSDILNNYNPELHSLSGVTQSSNAGTFTAYISPAASYKWYDATNNAKTITWTVNKKTISQPEILSQTTFAHDGSAKSISVSYDTVWITQGGTVSATAPGDYTATYTLKSSANTQFQNSSATTISVNWNIYRKKLSAALSQGFQRTYYDHLVMYDGDAKSAIVYNYNSNYHVLSGDVSAVNAGSYTAYISPVSDYDWADGYWTTDAHEAKAVTWEIVKAVHQDCGTYKTSYAYTGGNITVELVNFDSSIMILSGDNITQSEIGNYSTVVSFKDSANHRFYGGDSLTVNWSIVAGSVEIPTISNSNFTFNGDNKTAVVNGFDSTTMTSDGTVTASDAGTYSITFSLINTETSRWSDNTTANKVLSWTINRKALTADQSNLYQAEPLYYTGGVQYPNIANFDSNYHYFELGVWDWGWEYTSRAARAGSGTVKISVQNNYCWNDGTTAAKKVFWEIKKAVVNYNPAELNQVKTFNGENQEPSFTITSSVNNPVTKTGTWQAQNVGTYTAVASISDVNNIEFNGTTETSLTITWQINRKPLTVPQSSNFRQGESLTYNGASQEVFINNYDSSVHVLSSTTSATNAGNYVAQVSPKSNYAWNDTTFDAVNVNWSISKRKVDTPVASNTDLTYTGNAQTLDVTVNNPTLINETGDSLTQTNNGSYNRTYSLKDTANNEWADGSTDSKVINWSIGLTKVTPPHLANDFFYFNGNYQRPELVGFDSDTMILLDHSGSSSVSEVPAFLHGGHSSYGIYFFVILKDESLYTWDTSAATGHYCWTTRRMSFDGKQHYALMIYWHIESLPVPAANNYDKFVQSNTLNYDGNYLVATFNGFNSTYHKISSHSNINAGEYCATITLQMGYSWLDGSFDNRYPVYKINPTQLAIPTLTTDAVVTFDNQSHTAEIANVNSKFMDISGDNLTQTAEGVYSRTYTLKNTNNTTWATTDTSLAESPVTVTWEIRKQTFAKPALNKTELTVTQTNGNPNSKSVSVNNFDSSTMLLSGDNLTQKNAGNYSVTVSLKDPQLTQWDDSTNAAVALNWKINPAKNKKNVSVSAFTFDGKTKDLTKTTTKSSAIVYSSLYYPTGYQVYKNIFDLSGTTQASDAGVYSLTVSTTSNFIFEDGDTSYAIDWEIKPVKIDKPTKDSTTLTFNGNIQQAPISGYDSTTMVISGTTESSDAGNFTVTVSPDNNHVWQDGTRDAVKFTWSIGRKKLTSNQSDFIVGYYDYDGQTHSANVTNKDGQLVSDCIGTLYMLDTQSGHVSTYSAVNVGIYRFYLLPGGNYSWNTGTGGYKTAAWHINALKVIAPTLTSDNHFDYDGQTHTVTVNNPANISPQSGAVFSASKIGSYSIVYKCPANSEWYDSEGNKIGTDDIVFTWTIGDAGTTAVAKPYISSDDTFTYTGSAQSITVKNYVMAKMARTGSMSATVAGNYSVTYKLKSGYVWLDGSTADITLNWQILKAAISDEYSTFSQSGTLTFNGSDQTVTISGFNSAYHTTGGTIQASNAGTYSATVNLKDNYTWSDGSTDTKTVSWTINKKVVATPTASQTQFTYTGETINLLNYVSGYDSSIMNAVAYQLATVGSGSASFVLKDTANYKFTTGKTYFYLSWSVNPIYVDKPVATTTDFLFTGNNISPTFDGYDSTTMTISGNVQSDVGSYTATIALNDKINYRWAGDNNTTDISVAWKINVATYKKNYIKNMTNGVNYKGSEYSVRILHGTGLSNNIAIYLDGENLLPAHFIVSGDTKKTNAGTYTVYVEPTQNTIWTDGTRDKLALEWTIWKVGAGMSLSSSEVSVTAGDYASLTVTTKSDGAISAISGDSSIATTSINGKTIRVTGVGEGTTTVTVMQAEGTNYKATTQKVIQVDVGPELVPAATPMRSFSNAKLTSDDLEIQAAILDIQDAILDIYQFQNREQ